MKVMMFVFLLCGTPEYALVIEGDAYSIIDLPEGIHSPPAGVPVIKLEDLTGHYCV